MIRSTLLQAATVVGFVWQHPANKGRRSRALARAIAFQIQGRLLRQRLKTPIGQRSEMWAELHFTSSSKVLYANPPDFHEMRLWSAVLQPGDVFVDGGANVGAYTLVAAESGCHVIAVEPGELVLPRLRENIALNRLRVELHEVALSNEVGFVSFELESDATCDHITFARTDEAATVPATTLDALLGARRALGVKLDLEGAEELALAGAVSLLNRHAIAVLQLEWNSTSLNVVGHDRSPVARELRQRDYGLFRCGPKGELLPLDDERYGADVFAVAGASEKTGLTLDALGLHLNQWRSKDSTRSRC